MFDLLAEQPQLKATLDNMTEVAGFLWERGWAEANGGNLSADISQVLSISLAPPEGSETVPLIEPLTELAGHSFLVTGSGYRFRDFARHPERNACILRLNEDGSSYLKLWGGEGSPSFRPTSELPSHLGIHRFLQKQGQQNTLVLHTHPTELIALTHFPEYRDETTLNRALWGMLPEVKVLLPRGAGLAPYALPGSQALAKATVDTLKRGYPVVLWEMHGCLATGSDVHQAFDLIDTLNKAARILLYCRQSGITPIGLQKAQLDELVEAFNLKE